MKAFNNLKVGTKIFMGFFIILFLMILIGGMAILKITQINATVTDLADNLAKDQHIADQMVAKILLVRFYANKYIRDYKPDELKRFNEEFADFETHLAKAEPKITQLERVNMLVSIKAGVQAYQTHFLKVTQIMEKRHKVLSEILNVQGPLADDKLEQLRENAFQANDATALFYAGHTQRALQLMRLDTFKYFQFGNPQWIQKIEERYQEAQTAFKKLDEELQDPSRRQLAQEAQIAIDQYYQSFIGLQTDYVQQHEIVEMQLNIIGPQVRKMSSEMSASVSVDFDKTHHATQTLVTYAWIQLWVTMCIAIIIGIGLGFSISQNITKPLAILIAITDNLIVGNLNQGKNVKGYDKMRQIILRRDEIGNIGRVVENLTNYFQAVIEDIIQIAHSFASGNLRITSKAEYRGDFVQIKNALETASTGLLAVVEDIVKVSQGLAEGQSSITAQANYQGDFVNIKNALEKTSINLMDIKAKNATQDWLKTGQMQLNQKMSGEQELIALAKNVIHFLTTYLEAQIGVFYSFEEVKTGETEASENFGENGCLKLVASYAYTHRKGSPNEFQIGEGLVGQAALEKQKIFVTDVPEDYISIQSGLGETIPQNILVLPFLYEDKVKGVIEIASLHPMTDIQLEFLEQVMPNIGIAVNTAHSRSQMQHILQQLGMQSKDV